MLRVEEAMPTLLCFTLVCPTATHGRSCSHSHSHSQSQSPSPIFHSPIVTAQNLHTSPFQSSTFLSSTYFNLLLSPFTITLPRTTKTIIPLIGLPLATTNHPPFFPTMCLNYRTHHTCGHTHTHVKFCKSALGPLLHRATTFPYLQKLPAVESGLTHDVMLETVSYTHLTLPTIYSV